MIDGPYSAWNPNDAVRIVLPHPWGGNAGVVLRRVQMGGVITGKRWGWIVRLVRSDALHGKEVFVLDANLEPLR